MTDQERLQANMAEIEKLRQRLEVHAAEAAMPEAKALFDEVIKKTAEFQA